MSDLQAADNSYEVSFPQILSGCGPELVDPCPGDNGISLARQALSTGFYLQNLSNTLNLLAVGARQHQIQQAQFAKVMSVLPEAVHTFPDVQGPTYTEGSADSGTSDAGDTGDTSSSSDSGDSGDAGGSDFSV